MPFVFKKAQKAVSTLLIVATFLLLALLILVAKGSNLFEFKDRYVTVLNEGYGLAAGNSIRYKGVSIGRIRSMELTPDDKIRVDVEIFRRYRYLIKDDSVFKVSVGIIPGLGGSGIVLLQSINPRARPLEPGSMVFSSDMKQGQNIMAEIQKLYPKDDIMLKVQDILDVVDDLRPLITATMLNVRDSTESIKHILAQVEKDVPNMTQELDVMLVNINSIVKTLEGSMGSLDGTLKNIDNIVENISDMTEDDLRKVLLLVQENLIDLKKVMRNLPLGMGTGRDAPPSGTSISGGDR
jgi:phospholipid/cholesterol/gamma-HCH transport system substrate-binding protein